MRNSITTNKNSEASEGPLGHPLFPTVDGDDAPRVTEIQVCRHESNGRVWVPTIFLARDIPDLNFIQERWGGGRYEVIGRCNGKITARQTYTLPGASKPLVEEKYEVNNAPQAMTPQASQAMMPMPMGGGSSDSIMQMFIMMMQQMMQSQTQMIVAMMNGSGDRSKEYVQSMQALHDRHAEQSMASTQHMMLLMKELMGARGPQGSGDEFYKGVEFMREFAKAQVEMAKSSVKDTDDLSGVLETVMQAFQGFRAFTSTPGEDTPTMPLPDGELPVQ